MRAWTALATLVLVATALAGCSDEPEIEVPTLEVTADTGGIRGVVVDSGIRPLADVTVYLMQDPEQEVVTGQDGTFTFTGLEPGAYTVRAMHPLYATGSGLTDVLAGVSDPPAVRIILERIASGEPYLVTWKEDGFIACSANVGVAKSEECGEGVGVPGMGRIGKNPNNRAQIDFSVEGPHIKTLIVELVWEPNVEAGAGDESGQFDSRIALDWSCDPTCGGNVLTTSVGSSPLYMRVDAKQLGALEPTSETVFSTFTWAQDNPGVLLEQEYQAFIATFYHMPAPEGWSFVNGDEDPFQK